MFSVTSVTAWCYHSCTVQRNKNARNVGVDVNGRLFVSLDCPLILPYHIKLDQVRESGTNQKLAQQAGGLVPPMKTRSRGGRFAYETFRTRVG